MNAARVMTHPPITAGPTMSVRDVAKLFLQHAISAVPVLGASGTLLGIVSEGDLVRPSNIARDDRASWWLQVLAEGEDVAPEFLAYIRSGDQLARDLMTREVVTVEETTPPARGRAPAGGAPHQAGARPAAGSSGSSAAAT